jgi:hypothetical protein
VTSTNHQSRPCSSWQKLFAPFSISLPLSDSTTYLPTYLLPTYLPIRQLIKQLTSQRASQPTNHLINQPTNRPPTYPTTYPLETCVTPWSRLHLEKRIVFSLSNCPHLCRLPLHNRVHKILALLPVLSQMNPVQSWDGIDTWWGWRKIENQDKY